MRTQRRYGNGAESAGEGENGEDGPRPAKTGEGGNGVVGAGTG